MKKLIIYHEYFPLFGGIETAIYNLCVNLSKFYDIIVIVKNFESRNKLFLKFYNVADLYTLDDNNIYEGDICLIASNHEIPTNIKANRYIQWIHSDYEKYEIDLKNTAREGIEYVAVSNHAANIFKKLYKRDSQVIRNLIIEDDLENSNNPLLFVTNSRISPEKGFDRMLKFCQGLRDSNISFEWNIFGNNTHYPKYEYYIRGLFRDFPEVNFWGYQEFNRIKFILKNSNYLIQLSDFEGCPLVVLEALSYGVPCILTNFPSAYELITEGKNGYIVSLDMENIDYNKFKIIPELEKYDQSNEVNKWINILK